MAQSARYRTVTSESSMRQGARAAESLEQMGRLDCVHTSESFLRALGYAGGGISESMVLRSSQSRPLDRWDTATGGTTVNGPRPRGAGRRLPHGRGRRHSVADAAAAFTRRLSSLQMSRSVWSAASPEPVGSYSDGDWGGDGRTASETAAAAAVSEAAAAHGGRARAPPGWMMAEVIQVSDLHI
jgi:hypothetical protein